MRCGKASKHSGQTRPNKPTPSVDDASKSHHHEPMKISDIPINPQPLDPFSQRFHALSLAASLPVPYKKPEEVIAAAKKLEAYLTGEKK